VGVNEEKSESGFGFSEMKERINAEFAENAEDAEKRKGARREWLFTGGLQAT